MCAACVCVWGGAGVCVCVRARARPRASVCVYLGCRSNQRHAAESRETSMRAPFEKLPRLPTRRPPIPLALMLLLVLGVRHCGGNLQRTIAVASRRGHPPPQRHSDDGTPAWHRTGSRQFVTHKQRGATGRAVAFDGSGAAATKRRHVRATRHARAQLQAAAGRRRQHQPPCLASAQTRGWVALKPLAFLGV